MRHRKEWVKCSYPKSAVCVLRQSSDSIDNRIWLRPSIILHNRDFAAIFAAHFLTFFSSNFLKNALVFLVLMTLPKAEAEGMVAMVSATFMVPMIFPSWLGGRMTDYYDKSAMAR